MHTSWSGATVVSVRRFTFTESSSSTRASRCASDSRAHTRSSRQSSTVSAVRRETGVTLDALCPESASSVNAAAVANNTTARLLGRLFFKKRLDSSRLASWTSGLFIASRRSSMDWI